MYSLGDILKLDSARNKQPAALRTWLTPVVGLYERRDTKIWILDLTVRC